ncbi:helix-turn-helix domain-containing protein [Streptomyces sp. 5.8]|uniref:helix-turn-helix domain-containing protein n=1 Tax=Streptomyces sp. 5.8 TaxID=3406571 RepID=UPI003BB7C0DD
MPKGRTTSTAEQRRIVALYLAGNSMKAVALATDRSEGFIHNSLVRAGVRIRQRGGTTMARAA